MSTETRNQPDLIAYTVTKHGEREFYNRIGSAWRNKKGGYGLRLFALPVNGDIVLFPPKGDEDGDDHPRD